MTVLMIVPVHRPAATELSDLYHSSSSAAQPAPPSPGSRLKVTPASTHGRHITAATPVCSALSIWISVEHGETRRDSEGCDDDFGCGRVDNWTVFGSGVEP